jgi:N-acetylglutamate synthase/N-acetylornithine aminotransferase
MGSGQPNRVRGSSRIAQLRLDAQHLLLQGIEVFKQGEPTALDRTAASKAMAAEDVKLERKLGDGRGHATPR